jgi:dTDP-4-dehydrorhamnose reductase
VTKEIDATFVHYSTDYVFSGDRPDGYTESDTPGSAVNSYGESKLAGEVALQTSGARFYLLRTAWLYGAGGKNFVDTMLRLASEREELRVVNDQYGSPTYTRDVANATRELLTNFQPGIYHITNNGTATWYDLAKEACALAGAEVMVVPITSAEYPLPARRPQYSVLKNTGGPALRDWRDALKEYIKEGNEKSL